MAFLKRFFSESLYDPSLFRTVYIVNLLLCSVCFWDIAGVAVNVMMFIWSLLILIDMVFFRKNTRRLKQGILLTLFLAAGLLTAVLNIDSNFGVNFVMLYHTAICFFLFYGMHSEPDQEKVRVEIDRILKVIVCLVSALSIIGLLIMIIAPTGRLTAGGYLFGIMDNRFTGVYTNPNLAAFSSVIGIVCCHILMKRNNASAGVKRAIPLWLFITCIAVNGLSVLLSDSNSSLVFIVAYICVYLFCRFYQKSAGIPLKKLAVRAASLLLCCVLLGGSSLVLRSASQFAATELVNLTDQLRTGNPLVSFAIYLNGKSETTEENPPESEIGRTEDYELSSGRLDSLQKSMVLFRKFPLMGVGKGNILSYGEKYMINGFAFHDLHNGYLTILISDGLVGLALFMAFILMFGLRLVRFLRRNRTGNLKEFPALLAFLAAYCVFGLFEKAILFDVTFMVVIFWMLMGHTATFLSGYEWQEDTVDNYPALRVGGGLYRPGYTYYSRQEQDSGLVESYPLLSNIEQYHHQQGLSPPAPDKSSYHAGFY